MTSSPVEPAILFIANGDDLDQEFIGVGLRR
jgi:hypothetical protein